MLQVFEYELSPPTVKMHVLRKGFTNDSAQNFNAFVKNISQHKLKHKLKLTLSIRVFVAAATGFESSTL